MKNRSHLIIFALLFAFASSSITAAPSSLNIAINGKKLFADLTKQEVVRECAKSLAFAVYFSTWFTAAYAFFNYVDKTNKLDAPDYLRLGLQLSSFFVGLDFGIYLGGKHSLHTLLLNNYDLESNYSGGESYAVGCQALYDETSPA